MAASNELLLAEGTQGMERVRRKKDFTHMERVDGRMVNVLQGLALHTGVFSPAEQQRIVDCVHDLQDKGRRGLLKERTYSEPRKWMRGKGRATIQFGCCYNYATDRHGKPPGILRDEDADPLPPLLAAMVRRLVRWRVLPASCVPDSCIVNVYDVGDCIPPHVDHRDFLRPFCTVSFLAECAILFGARLRVVAPGEFAGDASISLPVGSVLVLNGNGADVAQHCVPAVPAKRISITFRKMDAGKVPFSFRTHPQLPPPSISPAAPPVRPLVSPSMVREDGDRRPGQQQQQQAAYVVRRQGPTVTVKAGTQMMLSSSGGASFSLCSDDFPALGAAPPTNRGRR